MSAPLLAAPNSVKLERVMKIIAPFTRCDVALFVHVFKLTINTSGCPNLAFFTTVGHYCRELVFSRMSDLVPFVVPPLR